GKASGRPRVPERARVVGRGAAEAQSAQAGDHRPGRAHLRHHAGGDLALARAPQRPRDPRRGSAVRMTTVARVDADAPTHDIDLASGIAALGLSLSAAQRAQLTAYLALLAKWNKTYNLTAIREPQRMVTHHLLDALAVVPHLPSTAGLRILDVGSGGGVPGIPLATARPDAHIVLVDS